MPRTTTGAVTATAIKAAIRAAERGGGRVTLRDGGGLLFKATRGGAVWVFEYRRKRSDGSFEGTKRITLGEHHEGFGAEEARAAARAARADLREGICPRAAVEARRARNRARTEGGTVAVAMRRFVEERSPRWTESSRRAYVGDTAVIAESFLGALPITLVTREQLVEFLAEFQRAKRAEGFSATARAVRLAQILSAVWRQAADGSRSCPGWGWGVDPNVARALPVAGADMLGERDRVLEPGEIRTLWKALTGETAAPGVGADARRILAISLATGMRIGAVAQARLEEVDTDPPVIVGARDNGPTWRIPARDGTKARLRARVRGESLVVPLSPLSARLFREAIAARRESRRDSVFVFPSPSTRRGDGPVSANSISGAWARLRVLGLAPDDTVAHDLRRTMRTELGDLDHPGGWHDEEQLIGHSVGGSVTRRYDRGRRLARLRALADAWGERLEAIVSAEPAEVVPVFAEREGARSGDLQA